MTEEQTQHDDPDCEDYPDTEPCYALPEAIEPGALLMALAQLHLLGSDPYMGMQAHNLDLVDQFLMDLEYRVLREWFESERTPPEAHFLGAQSQMWIFAAYELLRTWRQRAREIVKWGTSGGLQQKLEALKQIDDGYKHYGREVRIAQLEEVIRAPAIIEVLQGQLRITHVPFTRLEHIRVAMAKHEVSGRAKSVALMPGYGRLNMHCGSLDYELENGRYIIGTISRRDIADEIRALDVTATPPTQEQLNEFDAFMEGRM